MFQGRFIAVFKITEKVNKFRVLGVRSSTDGWSLVQNASGVKLQLKLNDNTFVAQFSMQHMAYFMSVQIVIVISRLIRYLQDQSFTFSEEFSNIVKLISNQIFCIIYILSQDTPRIFEIIKSTFKIFN